MPRNERNSVALSDLFLPGTIVKVFQDDEVWTVPIDPKLLPLLLSDARRLLEVRLPASRADAPDIYLGNPNQPVVISLAYASKARIPLVDKAPWVALEGIQGTNVITAYIPAQGLDGIPASPIPHDLSASRDVPEILLPSINVVLIDDQQTDVPQSIAYCHTQANSRQDAARLACDLLKNPAKHISELPTRYPNQQVEKRTVNNGTVTTASILSSPQVKVTFKLVGTDAASQSAAASLPFDPSLTLLRILSQQAPTSNCNICRHFNGTWKQPDKTKEEYEITVDTVMSKLYC